MASARTATRATAKPKTSMRMSRCSFAPARVKNTTYTGIDRRSTDSMSASPEDAKFDTTKPPTRKISTGSRWYVFATSVVA